MRFGRSCRVGFTTLIALGVASCASPSGGPISAAESISVTAEASPDVSLLNSVIPKVDHHKHLMGPAILAVANGAPLAPAITVPADVDALLSAREASWNKRDSLLPLYTPDAVLLSDSRSGWITGAAKVAEFLSTRFGRPYQITPTHFERRGNAAQLSGYYTRGEGEALQHLGYAHLSLVRSAAGWQIAAELPRFPLAPGQLAKDAAKLVAEMDESGVRRAVVLSEGFWADGPLIRVDDPLPVVMAENDWTAEQVARFPDRLIAFCSFNPVADHALRELERCAASGKFRGLKFSFAMSGVDLKNPAHIERLKAVFAAANARKLAMVVHSRGGPDYGADHARIFMTQVLSAAPDVVVQIAHLWGGEAYSRTALAAFADAIDAGDPHTRNLYFDLSEITAGVSQTATRAAQHEIAALIRRIGTDRMLFGSDGQNAYQSWRSLVGFIPLTESEARTIAGNEAPYLR